MNPSQPIRALAALVRLSGAASEEHAEAQSAGEDATWEQVVDILDQLTGWAADLADQAAPPTPEPPGGSPGRPRIDPEVAAEVLALAAQGLTDPQIGRALGLSRDACRYIRRQAGVIRSPGEVGYRSGWEVEIATLHAGGATDEEIATATGYSRRTIQEYRHRLNLPVNPAKS